MRGTVLLPLIVMAGCTSVPPPDLGLRQGELAPCPESPNCVSSQADDPDHVVEPLRYEGSPQAAWDALQDAVRTQPRVTEIEQRAGNYLHAEFQSAVFRFVDDVEFLAVPEQKVIHLRSASRIGYWDFGVNRRRVKSIRQAFESRLGS